ncbi:cache domain-containing protein [Methanospirillum hungatei]|uniref:cache domain-containing protein n=1 Tax=Methanospirillum hungatei TaxID=2203 RepID=UPI0026EA650F|nr:cache domain-containing protein [Methanospirillum hungatei]MCA1916983.1 cache domain-containing protein [Methanospirillum hungatei]
MNSSPDIHDLIRFVNEAVVYAQREGKESALIEFSKPNGTFTRGDLYIWAYDFDGINLAHPWHPEYQGNNKLDLADPDGFHMIAAMRDVALNGSGYVWYQYENPVTEKTEPKIAYVKRVDDTWWLASGIYGNDLRVPDDSPESVRKRLIDRVDEAVWYVKEHGEEEALAEFNDPSGPFARNESYIFAFDMNGTTRAMPFHQDRIGRNERDLTDENGVAIGAEKIMVAENGGGFFYYVFHNPAADNTPEFKISYVKPASSSLVVGTGTYLLDVPVAFPEEKREKMKMKVGDAVYYVHDQGKDAAIREFNDPNGTFSDPEMFIFAFDINGTLLANPYLPGLVGQNRLNDRDPYGKYPVQHLISNGEHGGGYTYYFFADPHSDYKIRLKLGYTEKTEDGLIIGAGIFPES